MRYINLRFTNLLTDRQDRQTDKQRTNSIGRTVSQTVAQNQPDVAEGVGTAYVHCIISSYINKHHQALLWPFSDFGAITHRVQWRTQDFVFWE